LLRLKEPKRDTSGDIDDDIALCKRSRDLVSSAATTRAVSRQNAGFCLDRSAGYKREKRTNSLSRTMLDCSLQVVGGKDTVQFVHVKNRADFYEQTQTLVQSSQEVVSGSVGCADCVVRQTCAWCLTSPLES
jgi:hypothetical protein